MYSIEGIIAALIIFGYVSNFLTLPAQQTDWGSAAMKQQSREWWSAFEKANLSSMIVKGNAEQFSGITKFFLGETRGISLTTQELFKPTITVGVLINESDKIKISNASGILVNQTCPLPVSKGRYQLLMNTIDLNCSVNMTPSNISRSFFIADNQSTNETIDFDSLWIDLNNNGVYDAREGPIVTGQAFTIGSTVYILGKIAENGSAVEFWDAKDVLRIKNNLSEFVLNERKTNFTVLGASPETGIDTLDALIVPTYQNLSAYKEQLASFLDSGKGIVELVSFSSQSQIDSVQRQLFGLNWSGLTIASLYGLNQISGRYPPYWLAQYFSSTPIRISTTTFDTRCEGPTPTLCFTGYSIGSINSTNGIYLIGNLTIKRANYPVVVINSSNLSYDRAYIDRDSDGFADETALGKGSYVIINSNNYTVKYIDPQGQFVDVTPGINDTFSADLSPSALISVHNASQYHLLISVINPNIPALIAEFGTYTGRTVWLPQNIQSQDEWNLVRAAVLWVSDKKVEMLRERAVYENSISLSDILFARGDMWQPFTVYLRVWYSA